MVLVGHSHLALSWTLDDRVIGGAAGVLRREGEVQPWGEQRWIFNPGSVGQPRDRDPAQPGWSSTQRRAPPPGAARPTTSPPRRRRSAEQAFRMRWQIAWERALGPNRCRRSPPPITTGDLPSTNPRRWTADGSAALVPLLDCGLRRRRRGRLRAAPTRARRARRHGRLAARHLSEIQRLATAGQCDACARSCRASQEAVDRAATKVSATVETQLRDAFDKVDRQSRTTCSEVIAGRNPAPAPTPTPKPSTPSEPDPTTPNPAAR